MWMAPTTTVLLGFQDELLLSQKNNGRFPVVPRIVGGVDLHRSTNHGAGHFSQTGKSVGRINPARDR